MYSIVNRMVNAHSARYSASCQFPLTEGIESNSTTITLATIATISVRSVRCSARVSWWYSNR